MALNERYPILYYALLTLTHKIGAAGKLFEKLQPFFEGGQLKGALKGCWYSEIGALNQVMAVLEYPDAGQIADDRATLLESGNPFGAADLLTDIDFSSYKSFPGVAPIQTGDFGPFFEVRRYGLTLDGLPPTFAAWDKVREERSKLSPLLMVMYALDGAVPHFVHIWPYRSLEERAKMRAKAVEVGIWPPPGGPPYLRVMRSDILLPAPFSPTR